jgi:threonine synthase
MNFYSTRDQHKTKPVSLAQAVLEGLAPDGGLYMPETIKPLTEQFFDDINEMDTDELNINIVQHLVGDAVSTEIVRKITTEALNFPMPLVKLEEGVYVMELFHGPTMAFKDVGARFMARLMAHFVEGRKNTLRVIVATSGDTGGAVAAGFFNVPGIEVYILYPKGKVSPLQEKQLTTWGGNITAIEVDGTFDDCQKLAKQVLNDPNLNKDGMFTSANSINIARLIPQSLYYFHAYRELKKEGKPLVISVPSGNFGNLTGGLLAKKMGLPILHFVAATNANDVVPEFLDKGIYSPRPSQPTISNAMDVGSPSNFERMNFIFGERIEAFRQEIHGYAYSDAETEAAMRHVHLQSGYMLDPHGAVGYLGLKDDLKQTEAEFTGVILETAHPIKFLEVVEPVLDIRMPMPPKMQAFADKTKMAISCPNNFAALEEILKA